MYRDEVRASKRYTFFDVEFRGIAYLYQVFCVQSAVSDRAQDIDWVIQFPVKVGGFIVNTVVCANFCIEGVGSAGVDVISNSVSAASFTCFYRKVYKHTWHYFSEPEGEYGKDIRYMKIMEQGGILTPELIRLLLREMPDASPEITAFLLRKQAQPQQKTDFFEELQL